MMLSPPDALTYADEIRELRHQVACQKLALSRRMGHNSPFVHPDAREPDDEATEDNECQT